MKPKNRLTMKTIYALWFLSAVLIGDDFPANMPLLSNSFFFDKENIFQVDENLRTYLMRYIIQQQGALANLVEQMRADVNKSFDLNENISIKLQKEKKVVACYKALLEQTIDFIYNSGILPADTAGRKRYLAKKDINGKTVIDYCQNKQIYDALRSVGAPFQLLADVYFRAKYYGLVGAGSLACLFLAGLGYQFFQEQKQEEEKFPYVDDIDIGSFVST